MSEEEKAARVEYTSYLAQLNKYAATMIHDMYGAALSGTENERAKGYIPTLEDDPIQIESKLKSLRDLQKSAQERHQVAAVFGMPAPDAQALENVLGTLVDADQLETFIKRAIAWTKKNRPTVTDAELTEMATKALTGGGGP